MEELLPLEQSENMSLTNNGPFLIKCRVAQENNFLDEEPNWKLEKFDEFLKLINENLIIKNKYPEKDSQQSLPTQINLSPCIFCKHESCTENELREHVFTQHINIQTYKCKTCPFESFFHNLISLHNELVHSGYTSREGYASLDTKDCLNHTKQLNDSSEEMEKDISDDDTLQMDLDDTNIKPEEEDISEEGMQELPVTVQLFEEEDPERPEVNADQTSNDEFPKNTDFPECITSTSGKKKSSGKDDGSVAKMQYACILCEFISVHKTSLKRHISRKHSMKKALKQGGFNKSNVKIKRNLSPKKKSDTGGKLRSNIKQDLCNDHIKLVDERFKFADCSHCNFMGNDEDSLIHHLKDNHPEVPIVNPSIPANAFTCTMCEFTASNRNGHKIHLKSVHFTVQIYTHETKIKSEKQESSKSDIVEKTCSNPVKRAKCNAQIKLVDEKFKFANCLYCKFQGNDGDSLITHMKNNHPEMVIVNLSTPKNAVTCDLCDFIPPNRHSLKIHIQSVHFNIRLYKCNLCDYECLNKWYLHRHRQTIHHELRTYSCTICAFKTKEKQQYKDHMHEIHLKVSGLSCTQCHYKCMTADKLLKHTQICHSAVEHSCKHCKFTANDKKLLLNHMAREHRQFPCSFCDYVGSSRFILKNHVKVNHLKLKETPYKCLKCSGSFRDGNTLRRHDLAVHRKYKPFACDKCNYRCVVKGQLDYHTRNVHLKIMRYSCDLCDYKCAVRRYLQVHIYNNHSPETKPFPCLECNKSFTAHNKLRVHTSAIHMGEKNFKCTLCSYAAASNSHVKRHMLNVHSNIKPFSCNYCSYAASQQSNLRGHIKRIHSNLKV